MCNLRHSSYITDQELAAAWDAMGAKQRVVFHEDDVKDAHEFIDLARDESVHFWFAEVDGKTAAITWLNSFEGFAARVHHCFFKGFYGQAATIARDAIQQMFVLKRVDGRPLVRTIFGLTPSDNVLAVKMAKRVGMTIVAEIPDACWIASKQLSVSGVFSYIHCSEFN